jgi:hypothetical protein
MHLLRWTVQDGTPRLSLSSEKMIDCESTQNHHLDDTHLNCLRNHHQFDLMQLWWVPRLLGIVAEVLKMEHVYFWVKWTCCGGVCVQCVLGVVEGDEQKWQSSPKKLHHKTMYGVKYLEVEAT